MSDTVVEKKKPGRPKKSNIFVVSIDTSYEDVVKSDQEGLRIDFVTDGDSFPKFTKDQLDDLSKFARATYFLCKQEYDRTQVRKGSEPTPGLKISPRLVSASDKLDVRYPEGWRDKWHPVFKRADEAFAAQANGYEFVNVEKEEDSGIQAFGAGKNTAGSVVVGDAAHDELILMKEPVAQNDERVRLVGEKSRIRKDGVDARTIDDIRRSGGLPYVPPKGATDPHNFGPPSE